MIKYFCAVCGTHLYNREKPFEKDEMIGSQGLTRPDGQPTFHGAPIHWCGCESPPKGQPSLVAEEPTE